MSEPTTEFLRRGQVLDWLGPDGVGFSRSYVRELLAQKIIKGAPLPERKATTRKSGKRIPDTVKNGKCDGNHRGRKEGELTNYYRKSQIKKELGI